MTVGSDHYLINAKILFANGKSKINEVKENITDCAVELLQVPTYNIGSLRTKILVFLYKKRLDEKFGEGNFESTGECYQHLIECIHQAAKEALGGKTLRNNTKLFY
jgi:hypothetical protein